MSRSRGLHRKHVKCLRYFDPSQQNLSVSKDWGHGDNDAYLIASGEELDHDSCRWRVEDDWPKQIPITSDEIETIEAFLRDMIDEFFR